MKREPLGRLYLVGDRRLAEAGGRSLEGAIDEALAGLGPGRALVQLREKDLGGDELVALGRRVLAACRRRGAPLVVNGDIDVALAIGADGVQLPEGGADVGSVRRRCGPPFLIGRSTHGIDGATAAAAAGADLIVFGPVWATPSKLRFGAPRGTDELAAVARILATTGAAARLYAVGGITEPARVAAACAAGAHGVAVVRAVLCAADPAAAAVFLASALSPP